MCEFTYSISPIGDLDGDGFIDIMGGGDMGSSNEAIWILYVKKIEYSYQIGSILGFIILGFFSFIGLGTCIYMSKNRTY